MRHSRSTAYEMYVNVKVLPNQPLFVTKIYNSQCIYKLNSIRYTYIQRYKDNYIICKYKISVHFMGKITGIDL